MNQRLLYIHNAEIGSTMANVVQVMAMCRAWIQSGFGVTLVLRSKGYTPDHDIQQFKEHHGAPPELKIILFTSLMPSKVHRHLAAMRIPSLIRSQAPDFCFVRDPAFFRAVLKTGTPVIMELHNTRLHLGFQKIDNRYRKWVITGSRHPACIQVIAISEALAKHWTNEGIPKEKMLVLHDGFTPDQFNRPYDRTKIRQRYQLPVDEPVVVYTGNLQENRGIEYLIMLAEMNPKVLFFVAGGSPDRVEYFRKYSKENALGNLVFRGQIPHVEVPALLAAADVLLAVWSNRVPTINVCSPLKVFEYMASGIPSVYPAYPTIHEVIEEGKNGFLAVPDDPESLNHALHRALSLSEQDRDEYYHQSRAIAFERYSWDSRVSAIVSALPEKPKPA